MNRSSPPSKRDVLVVDDDVELAEIIRLALEASGYDVRLARDGGEALERVNEAMPGLILLDMQMPKMNGWQFVERFHERFGHQAPIIVVTAAEQARRRAAEVGAVGVLPKPFALDTFLRTVAEIWNREPPQGAVAT